MSKSTRIAGVDEAGRGALAGPVVAAAVILHDDIPGLADSKTLTEKQRESLYQKLMNSNAEITVSLKGPRTIEKINILAATMAAMKQSILRLETPDKILIDGNRAPKLPINIPIETIIKGDTKVPCISAASIIAKVLRDKLLCRYAQRYPGYALEKHKGYATQSHYTAIQKHGPLNIHRRTFTLYRQQPLFEVV